MASDPGRFHERGGSRRCRGAAVMALGLAGVVLASCATGTSDRWAKPGAAPALRLAVLPFENQTAAPRAGAAAADLLASGLMAGGRIAVMDPSEVADLLRRESLDPGEPGRLPSAQRVGRLLQVSHVLQGSVTEFRYKPGVTETPAVGFSARVIEVASGEVVWTAAEARTGSSWLQEDSLARIAQTIARDMAEHLSGALGATGARPAPR